MSIVPGGGTDQMKFLDNKRGYAYTKNTAPLFFQFVALL